MANLLYSIKSFLLYLFLTIPVALMGQQVLFNKTIDFTPQIEALKASVVTEDGGSLSVVGYWSSIPGMEYDSTQLVKLDEYGCLEWEKLYDFLDGQVVETNIVKGFEDNYLINFRFENPDTESVDCATANFSLDGDFLSLDVYGWNDSNDAVLEMKLLEDGGLIMVGRHTFGMGPRGFAIRTDATGSVLWELKYLEIQSVFSDVVVAPNGDYWITVNASIGGSGTKLLKVNDSGDIIEDQELFTTTPDDTDITTVDILFVNDSIYLVSGTGRYFDIVEHTILGKFGLSGNIIWTYIAEQENLLDDRTEDMVILPDGSTLIGGWEDTPDLPIYERGWIKKISESGDLLWDIDYVPIDTSGLALYGNRVLDLDLLEDGSIVMTGSANYILADTMPYLNTKIWTMKIDEDGNYLIPLEASLTTENLSIYVEDSTLLNLEILSSNGCYSYDWSGNGAMYVEETSTGIYFVGSEVGMYEVSCTVTDETGATFTSSLVISVNEQDVGLSEIAEKGIHLYPNPAPEFISIRSNQPKEGLLYIYDNVGKLVTSMTIERDFQINEIEVNDWSNGVYLYEFMSKDNQILDYGKFIVQH